jgi:integrase
LLEDCRSESKRSDLNFKAEISRATAPWTHPATPMSCLRSQTPEPRADATRRQLLIRASSICTYAAKNGWIPRNPCVDIQLPQCLPADPHLLSPPDRPTIAGAGTRLPQHAIWTFEETGCRLGDVYGPRVRNVDLTVFWTRSSMARHGTRRGTPILSGRGSRKPRPRILAITPWLAALWSALLPRHNSDSPIRPADLRGTATGRRRVWLRALADAGLDGVEPLPGPHDLRRLYATQPAASGVDLRTLMNRMGHKSAKLALEVYANADPVADRAAAETIGTHP